MKRPLVFLLAGVLVISIVGVAAVKFHSAFHMPHSASTTATYYCPMHPTYISDRPGNCPICQMKLVKAEAHDHPSGPFGSICYLHNCAKLHDGKPCPMTVVAKPGEQVTCPICGTHIAAASSAVAQRKILYWTDPMIPGYKADKRGKSPMGMDLVPVYTEDAGQAAASTETPQGYAPVLLTPQKQQLVGIKTAAVERRALQKTIRAAGTIAHDPELYQAQQEFIQAYQSWQRASAGQSSDAAALAQQLVDSSRLRLRHLGLSEELINEVATWTQPDHRLLLGGAGQYWIYASIYEYELPLVRSGQQVSVEVSAFPGQVFTGTVKAIDPMLDEATRTARARVLVDDPSGVLKPSMYVNVSIKADLGEVLAIPEEAVFSTGEQQIVFVDKGQGLLEPHQVTLGMKADGFYEAKSGVESGESVVTSGNFLIDSESRLKGALQAR